MTRIEDMSETERQAWMTLIVDVTVLIYFVQTMTTGWSINTFSPAELLSIFIGIIIVTIILHAVIAGVFELRKRNDEVEEKDERDINIERKGAALAFGFLAVAINIVIGQLLLENTIEGHSFAVSLKNLSHLFFILTGIAFIGDIIKNGRMILAYRGE